MYKLFVLLFFISFWVAVFFFVKAYIRRTQDNSQEKKIAIYSIAICIVSFFIFVGLSALEEKGANNGENDMTAGTSQEDENDILTDEPINGYAAVDKFYEDLIANNTTRNSNDLSDQVKELADKYGLFRDSKNNGLGVMYHKIASTREEATVISNSDIYNGTYYVYIIADYTKGQPEVHLIDNINHTDKHSGGKEDLEQITQSPALITTDPIEMNTLQALFASLTSSTTRDDIDAIIEENGFVKYAFTHDSAYYIGYENTAVRQRGRDRVGEAVDVEFITSGKIEDLGKVKSAEYAIHTESSTKYLLKFEDGIFYYDGKACANGEEAMQLFLQNK